MTDLVGTGDAPATTIGGVIEHRGDQATTIDGDRQGDRRDGDVERDEDGVPIGDFARDTALRPDAAVPGRYHGEISDAWRIFFAFGGVSMAVALRGAQEALGRPDLSPLAATATFIAPVPCGPVVVDAEVLRSGKAAAQVVSRLSVPGTEGEAIHLTATFAAPQPGPAFIDSTYPDDALPIEGAESPPPQPEGSPFRSINFHHQTDFRMARRGQSMRMEDWEPGGPARSLSWHRLLRSPLLADGTLDPISYCVPADMIGPAIFSKLGPPGPDTPPSFVLSLEIGLQVFATTTSSWLLQHAWATVVEDGFAHGHVELWDCDRRLVAAAHQRAHLRPVDPSRFPPGGTA